MSNTINQFHISLHEKRTGFLCFKMTNFVDEIECVSVRECLQYFGLETSEESIREWSEIANIHKTKSVLINSFQRDDIEIRSKHDQRI